MWWWLFDIVISAVAKHCWSLPRVMWCDMMMYVVCDMMWYIVVVYNNVMRCDVCDVIHCMHMIIHICVLWRRDVMWCVVAIFVYDLIFMNDVIIWCSVGWWQLCMNDVMWYVIIWCTDVMSDNMMVWCVVLHVMWSDVIWCMWCSLVWCVVCGVWCVVTLWCDVWYESCRMTLCGMW